MKKTEGEISMQEIDTAEPIKKFQKNLSKVKNFRKKILTNFLLNKKDRNIKKYTDTFVLTAHLIPLFEELFDTDIILEVHPESILKVVLRIADEKNPQLEDNLNYEISVVFDPKLRSEFKTMYQLMQEVYSSDEEVTDEDINQLFVSFNQAKKYLA